MYAAFSSVILKVIAAKKYLNPSFKHVYPSTAGTCRMKALLMCYALNSSFIQVESNKKGTMEYDRSPFI